MTVSGQKVCQWSGLSCCHIYHIYFTNISGEELLGACGIRVRTHSRGGDLVPTMPVCVCQKVKDMGPFLASSE